MNARPEDALGRGEVERQAATNDNPRGSSLDRDSDRQYICLDCDQQLDSFTMECPNCGGQQFQTTVPGISSPAKPTGYDIFGTMLARFNPYIPR